MIVRINLMKKVKQWISFTIAYFVLHVFFILFQGSLIHRNKQREFRKNTLDLMTIVRNKVRIGSRMEQTLV